MSSAGSRSTVDQLMQLTRSVLRFVLLFVLCLVILAVFIPLNPSMPSSGTDMSWMMAMNQAVAQHLVFGRDIIFTYGPYASIYTKVYHPATDRLMIWGSALLGVSYFGLLLLLGTERKFYGVALYGLFLACLVNSRDALLFTYPLILALVAYRITLPEDHTMKLRLTKSLETGLMLLLASLGLLPLTKGSLSPLCGVIAVLCCVLFWRAEQKILAGAVILVPAVSCVLLWVLAGQPVTALPRFFLSTQQIISGYTEAMAAEGDPFEWFLYLLAWATVLLVVVWTAHGRRSSRWFLVGCYGMFLFTVFKVSFIRHEKWHDVTAGSSILAAALLLMFVVGEKRALAPLAMATFVWAYTNHSNVKAMMDDISLNSGVTFQGAFLGVRARLKAGQLEKEYKEHIAAIQKEFPVDRMPGTTDIYSYNQSWLLASENTWVPRPVVQSYSAYTAKLAELDRRHVESKSAPDNILFRVEPINGHLPSLEDGLSWPALINGYAPWKLDGQGLYMRRRPAAQNSIAPMQHDLYESRYEFGEEVSLPESDDPLFARIETKATFIGRILSALFKPPGQLRITLRLRDGRGITYRAISDVMRTDFLISPLVDGTEQFAVLAAGRNKYLVANRVKSIILWSDDRQGWFWNRAYTLSLRKIDLQKNTEAENLLLFDEMSSAAPASLSPPATLKCEGSIEGVNGGLPSVGITSVESVLTVNGWMGISAKDGIVPDSVFVSLTSESGGGLYVKARSTVRNDVKRHFNQPEMPNPGYAALIDVSSLTGRYTLGLARMYQGNLGVCQQFKLPLLLNP
jgi:hypothetical protein